LQCTSLYPSPPEKIGLNLIPFFRERYGCAVGLSDHSGTVYAGLAAATMGIEMLELHITFSRETFGPDVPASITTAELRQLVDGVRFIERMNASPVDKDSLLPELKGLRELFTKSVVVRCELPAGTILNREHLTVKKPGTGIPAAQLDDVVGRKLRHAVAKDHLLQASDFD